MTALAEALLAAQRQAIGALSKAYVAGTIDDEMMRKQLDNIGCTDTVDKTHLLASLGVLQIFGAPAPRATQPEPQSRKAPEAATVKQLKLIEKLVNEKALIHPDVVNSKEQASEIIDAINNGTYNADNYTVPF